MKKLNITVLENGEVDNYVCECGNSSASNGFYSCDINGVEVEPDKHWGGLYCCGDRGSLSYVDDIKEE